MAEPIKKLRFFGYLRDKKSFSKKTKKNKKSRLFSRLKKRIAPAEEVEEKKEIKPGDSPLEDAKFIFSGFKDGIVQGVTTMIIGAILYVLVWGAPVFFLCLFIYGALYFASKFFAQ